MPRLVTLSNDDGVQLRQILELLGIDQKTVSEEADVSRPWLSGLLKADTAKSVDSEMVSRVASVLAGRLRQQSEDTLNSDLGRMATSFLSRFLPETGDQMPNEIYPPGGPVPTGARHYVQPPDFDKAFAGFQKPVFTMIVRGPAQCGKSSLIARVKEKADAIGIQTLLFDPSLSSVQRKDDATSWATIALCEQLQAEWGLDTPNAGPTTSLSKLGRWLQEALAPTASKKRLLILDDLASLGPDEATNWLRIFVRKMHNDRAFAPQVQLSVLLGVTHLYGPEFEIELLKMSSAVHWSPRIELTWFEPNKAKEIVDGVSEKEIDADAIFRLVGGQPYLTHAAAMYPEFCEALTEWDSTESDDSANQLMGSDAFRRHLTAIKLGILGQRLEVNEETRALLGSFIKSCRREPIDPDHKSFLQKVGLLKSNGEPALKMYELFARDFENVILK